MSEPYVLSCIDFGKGDDKKLKEVVIKDNVCDMSTECDGKKSNGLTCPNWCSQQNR